MTLRSMGVRAPGRCRRRSSNCRPCATRGSRHAAGAHAAPQPRLQLQRRGRTSSRFRSTARLQCNISSNRFARLDMIITGASSSDNLQARSCMQGRAAAFVTPAELRRGGDCHGSSHVTEDSRNKSWPATQRHSSVVTVPQCDHSVAPGQQQRRKHAPSSLVAADRLTNTSGPQASTATGFSPLSAPLKHSMPWSSSAASSLPSKPARQRVCVET